SRAGLYRNVRTNVPVRFSMRDGRLFGNTLPLTPLAATRFRVGGAEGPIVEFDPAPAGTRASLRMIGADGDTVAYEPVEPWTPANPAAFTGEYRSDEAEVDYTVAVENGKLVMRRRPDVRMELTPAYRDAFTMEDGWVMRFTRDRAGRVNGFG